MSRKLSIVQSPVDSRDWEMWTLVDAATKVNKGKIKSKASLIKQNAIIKRNEKRLVNRTK
jgi:hypothetical protein